MTHLALKNNLQQILKQRDWSVAQLERKAQIKKHSVQNILRDTSKNPTIELVSSIAKALDISIEELIYAKELVFVTDLHTYAEICNLVLSEIKKHISKPIPQKTIFLIIEEVFAYTTSVNNNKVEPGFIKWIIMQKFSE